jgi:cell division protease FtsH
MSSTMMPTPQMAVPHIPPPDDRTPKTRRKMMFYDRIKVLLVLSIILAFLIAKYHAEIPIISWGEAARNQIAAKSWLLFLMAIEAVRQLHYVASEKSKGWHRLWSHTIFGGWDRFWGRRNPWLRYRMARIVKGLIWFAIGIVALAGLWGKDIFETVVDAPLRVYNALVGQAAGLPFIFQILLTLSFAVMQFVAIFWFMSRGGVDTYLPDEVDTRFADVWGQDKVVEKVRENIDFLEKPEEIEARGGHVPSGILLWGPPGTGKTLLAKAVAGETGRPFVFVDPGAFQAMFMGVGIMKVKALFKKLRKLALRHGGVIVFFDEADSLGNRGIQVSGKTGKSAGFADLQYGCNGLHYLSPATSREVASDLWGQARATQAAAAAEAPPQGGIRQIIMGGMGGGGGGMGTLQALLTEISGLEKPRGFMSRRLRSYLTMPAKKPPKYRILIMMATNAPDALDEALLRPGRLDRQYKVDFPTLKGRIRTYDGYFNKIKHSLSQEQIDRLALMSPNASGATIKDIVNESLIVAMRAGRDVVTWPDVLNAKGQKTHGMPDDVHPMSLERHSVAIHEAGHAVAMYRLLKRFTIDVATIEPRGAVGGFVSWVPLEEPSFAWRSEKEHDVMISLASLAAERHFFGGDNSVGVGGDLGSGTSVVRTMEGRHAMGTTITSFTELTAGDPTKAAFDERVEARLQELFARTATLIQQDERNVMAIAHALERYHTVTGEDIDAIFKGTKGPIVDGTWYHSPEFEFVYKRFHAEALRAHQTQGKLDVPLPLPGSLVVMDTSGIIRSWGQTEGSVTTLPAPVGELPPAPDPWSRPVG